MLQYIFHFVVISLNPGDNYQFSQLDSSIDKQAARRIEKVNKQFENKNKRISRKFEKTIAKLSAVDSVFIDLNNSNKAKTQIQDALIVNNSNVNQYLVDFDLKNYSPVLDSVSTLLNFANQSNLKNILPVQQLTSFQNELQILNRHKLSINNYINIIRNYNITNEINRGKNKINEDLDRVSRKLDDLRIESEQLQNISSLRDITNLPQLRQVYNSEDFLSFFKSNSFISRFFSKRNKTAGDIDLEKELVGLQTREVLLADIKNKFGTHVNSVSDLIKKDLPQNSSGLGQLSEVKDRANSALEEKQKNAFSNQVVERSPLKTKSEIGFTIQTSRPNILLPFTTDLGLSYGLAIGKKFVTGAGAAYRFSITNFFQNATFSSEGYSLRYFIHFMITKNLRVTNEYDHGFLHNMPAVRQDQNIIQSNNQKRYTLGVMKSLPLKKRKYNIEVMYDLLHKSNPIQAQPFIFRTGFTF